MISELLQQITSTQQRGLLQLQGQAKWGRNYLNDWLSNHLENHPDCAVTWFGEAADDKAPAQVTDLRIKKYQSLLGQECDVLIFDCYAGFSPDALGALAGTIRAGGLCILLTPNNNDWPGYLDPEHNRLNVEPYTAEQITGFYLSRLAAILEDDHRVFQLCQSNLVLKQRTEIPHSAIQHRKLAYGCANSKQLVAVGQILQLANGKEAGALVLEADRGRGKSTALGLAAAALLETNNNNEQPLQILLTSPRMDSTMKVLETIATRLQLALNCSEIKLGHSVISFVAPDQLSKSLPPADLVLVDEAAAIPSQLLKPIVSHYSKLVFATTIHGYEGTGRGFEYKFKPLLLSQFPTTQFMELKQPIRWGEKDLLEPVIERILALDAEAPEIAGLDINQAQLRHWSSPELVENEVKLKQIFGLLVYAHYRTSPQDLRYILDGANLSVFTMEVEGTSVAAALVASEGPLPESLLQPIWQGRRRPKGHLLPQSLMAHAGFIEAGNFRYGRVVRITVHPELQSKGLGAELLQALSEWGHEHWDFLSTSFGASCTLLKFWQRSGFTPVRFGVQAEASTGECSLLMLKPLNDKVVNQVDTYHHRLQQTLLVEKNAGFRVEHQQMLDALIEPEQVLNKQLDKQDKLDLQAFALHFRGLENAWLALYKLALLHPDAHFLVEKCLRNLTNKELLAKYQVTGEKQLVKRLRALVADLI